MARKVWSGVRIDQRARFEEQVRALDPACLRAWVTERQVAALHSAATILFHRGRQEDGQITPAHAVEVPAAARGPVPPPVPPEALQGPRDAPVALPCDDSDPYEVIEVIDDPTPSVTPPPADVWTPSGDVNLARWRKRRRTD